MLTSLYSARVIPTIYFKDIFRQDSMASRGGQSKNLFIYSNSEPAREKGVFTISLTFRPSWFSLIDRPLVQLTFGETSAPQFHKTLNRHHRSRRQVDQQVLSREPFGFTLYFYGPKARSPPFPQVDCYTHFGVI